MRAAARRTAGPDGKLAVSSGRWYQLESGWAVNKGIRIPIGTKAATVVAAARAINWDIDEALRSAGFTPDQLPAPEPPDSIGGHSPGWLDEIPTDVIIEEIRVLFAEVRRRIPRVDGIANKPQYWSKDFRERLSNKLPPVGRREDGDHTDQLGG